MTLFVFLSAAAVAGIVAADFWLVALDLPNDIVTAGARGPGWLGNRRRPRARSADRAEWRGRGSRRYMHRHRRRRARLFRCGRHRHRRGVVADHRHQPPQVADHLFFDAVPHLLEEPEAFLLVLDQGIALAVAAQADAFLQVIQAIEVVLPLRVDDLQHDVALDAM